MSSLYGFGCRSLRVLKYTMLVVLFCVVFGASSGAVSAASEDDDVAGKVICNVIVFVQKLGLPIMTGVILGSSIMAIFGKVSWPAIVMLVVFTGIFFGAGKLMQKFAAGLSDLNDAKNFDCAAKKV